MSDVLDIQSQCCSELEEEGDGFLLGFKGGSKTQKGRGFNDTSGSQLVHIKNVKFTEYENSSFPQPSVEGWVLFIQGIHEEASEDDVKELFSEYGRIKNLILNLDRRTGYIKGYALMEFESYDEAYNAKENLNEIQLLGQMIKVNWAFSKGPNTVQSGYIRKKKADNNFRTYKRF